MTGLRSVGSREEFSLTSVLCLPWGAGPRERSITPSSARYSQPTVRLKSDTRERGQSREAASRSEQVHNASSGSGTPSSAHMSLVRHRTDKHRNERKVLHAALDHDTPPFIGDILLLGLRRAQPAMPVMSPCVGQQDGPVGQPVRALLPAASRESDFSGDAWTCEGDLASSASHTYRTDGVSRTT